jgi:hypothetical protein
VPPHVQGRPSISAYPRAPASAHARVTDKCPACCPVCCFACAPTEPNRRREPSVRPPTDELARGDESWLRPHVASAAASIGSCSTDGRGPRAAALTPRTCDDHGPSDPSRDANPNRARGWVVWPCRGGSCGPGQAVQWWAVRAAAVARHAGPVGRPRTARLLRCCGALHYVGDALRCSVLHRVVLRCAPATCCATLHYAGVLRDVAACRTALYSCNVLRHVTQRGCVARRCSVL